VSVTDVTERGQTDSITFELDLKHPPAKVWRALTEPALLAQWLLPATGLRLEPGAAFRLQAPVMPGWDGIVDCRMLEIEPQRRLSYTWAVGGMELDTVVTFTMTPTPSGTSLRIVQSGFREDQKQNWGGARYGWKLMGGKLDELLGREA
jgi:uncharacterized protein YndB with AHSA1/START domain